MPAVICSLAAMVILSEGSGRWLLKRLNIEPDYAMYAAPLGTAFLFMLLQFGYAPLMLEQRSFIAVSIISLFVILFAAIVTAWEWKDVFHMLFRARTIYLIFGAVLLAGLCRKYGMQDMLAQSELLQMNEKLSSHIEAGQMQGYELLGSLLVMVFRGNLELPVLMMGLFASAIGMMLSLNYIDSFNLPNPWFRFTLIFFSLFYCNYYSWKIVGGFLGENWRLLMTGLAMYVLYRWLKTGKENIKYLFPIVIAAGLFVNHSFLLLAIELIYGLFVFLLKEEKIRSLYDTVTFLIPVVFYGIGMLYHHSRLWAWILTLAYIGFLLARYKKSVYHKYIHVENFLISYNTRIFFVLIPVIFLVGTFILRFFVPGYGIEYKSYIQYFSHRTTADFLFPRGSILDSIMDLWRWAGMIIFIHGAFVKEDRMLKYLGICMIIFFINPLCMGMLAKITGIETYACAFEIIFNPFTDIVFFIAIYRLFEWTVVGQWILELCLVFVTLFGHVASYADTKIGLYGDLIQDPKTVKEILLP